VRERMERSSGLVYAGKEICGTPGAWRKLGRGEVVIKIVVRWGI
jgi:hypothetical protein